MKCWNCGEELRDDERFCSKCGAQLQQVPVQQSNQKPNSQSPVVVNVTQKKGHGCLITAAICLTVIVLAYFITVGIIMKTVDKSTDKKQETTSTSVVAERATDEELFIKEIV